MVLAGIWRADHKQTKEEKNMVKIMNECCNCATPGYPCRGKACERQHVKHLICNRCGMDVEELYVIDGQEICLDCLPHVVETIVL